MKHLLHIGLFVSICSIVSVACSKEFQVTSVVLYPETHEMAVGDSIQLRAAINYEGADKYDDESILITTWTSSDPSVATVSDKGLVKGVGEGEAVITLNCDGTEAQAAFTITPAEAEEPEE